MTEGTGKRKWLVSLAEYNKKKRITRNWELYLMLLLPVAYFAIFQYIPMYGLQIAFKDYVPSKGYAGSEWVGMKHFATFFKSYYAPITIKNTLSFALATLVFGFPMSVLLALSINEVKSSLVRKSVSTITYAPYFLALTVVVTMLNSFLDPKTGIVNELVKALGGSPHYFMVEPKAFLPIYLASEIWQTMGWGSIIYLAALSGVNPQLYEAASMDGASKFQKMIHINLPAIIPTIVIVFIMQTGKILNVGYEKIYLMQNEITLDVSEVINLYIYRKGIQGAQYSLSTAIGLLNSACNFIVVAIVNKVAKKISGVGLW